jgi:hypothetical protein
MTLTSISSNQVEMRPAIAVFKSVFQQRGGCNDARRKSRGEIKPFSAGRGYTTLEAREERQRQNRPDR